MLISDGGIFDLSGGDEVPPPAGYLDEPGRLEADRAEELEANWNRERERAEAAERERDDLRRVVEELRAQLEAVGRPGTWADTGPIRPFPGFA